MRSACSRRRASRAARRASRGSGGGPAGRGGRGGSHHFVIRGSSRAARASRHYGRSSRSIRTADQKSNRRARRPSLQNRGVGRGREGAKVQRRRFRCSARAAARRVKRGSGGADPTGVVWLDLLVFVLLLGFTLLGAWRGALESGLRLGGLDRGLRRRRAGGRRGGGCDGRAPRHARLARHAPRRDLRVPRHADPLRDRHRAGAASPRGERAGERRPRPRRALRRGAGSAWWSSLVGWLALFADALRSEGLAAGLPSVEGSLAAEWSGVVVESGAGAMLGTSDPGARAATALAARPRQSLEALRTVLDHPRVVALERDAEFWNADRGGRASTPPSRCRARARWLGTPACASELATLGLVDAAAGTNPLAFQQAFEDALRAAAANASPRCAAIPRCARSSRIPRCSASSSGATRSACSPTRASRACCGARRRPDASLAA